MTTIDHMTRNQRIRSMTLLAAVLTAVLVGEGAVHNDKPKEQPRIVADLPALTFIGATVTAGAAIAGCGSNPEPISCSAAVGASTLWVGAYGNPVDPTVVFPLASNKWNNALSRY